MKINGDKILGYMLADIVSDKLGIKNIDYCSQLIQENKKLKKQIILLKKRFKKCKHN